VINCVRSPSLKRRRSVWRLLRQARLRQISAFGNKRTLPTERCAAPKERGANPATNRVFDRGGREKSGERTLAYFIAHEITHAMSIDHFGLGFHRLSPFQKEGYAVYVARAQPVDLRAGRAAMNRNDDEMDSMRSGLYDRYRLLVAYELERRGQSVDQLLGQRLEQPYAEARLRADTGL
jgi:hypothetical protein